MTPPPEQGERAYTALLALYPRRLRDTHEEEYLEVFRYRRDRWRAKHGALGPRFWLYIARDALVSAARERRDPLDSKGRPAEAGKRGGEGMLGGLDDLRYAGRRLLRSPGFTLTAMTILVIGIGVCATAFSVVNSLLLTPPPFEDPDRVVEVLQDSDGGPPSSTSYPAYQDIARTPDVFSSVSAFSNGQTFLQQDQDLAPILIEYATASYLEVIGLSTSRGVWFGTEHDDPSGPPAAVITYGMWQDRLAGDPDILGSTLRINGAAVTVVGVGPAEFNGGIGPTSIDLWLSISSMGRTGGPAQSLDRRTDHPFTVRARLAPSVSLEQASIAMDVLASELERDYPEVNTNRRIHVLPLTNTPDTARLAPAALFTLAVTLLVLVVATFNLANLLLVRSTAAAREMAVRVALGAGRARVMRVVMGEALILSLLGGAGGLAVAALAARLLRNARFDALFTVLIDLRLDTTVVLFAAALSAGTALVFGLLPALRATRRDVNATLQDRESETMSWRRGFGVTGALVTGQVAVSLLVLAVAGAFVESILQAQGSDPGFDWEGTAYITINATPLELTEEGTVLLMEQLEERFESLPDVARASRALMLPAAQLGTTTLLLGSGIGDVDRPTETPWNYVTPNYFDVMEVPLLFGRVFNEGDMEGTRVAVVSESFARAWYGRSDVVGETYRSEGAPDTPVEIVGVVANAVVRSLGEDPTPSLYWALNFAFPSMHYLLDVDGPPADVLPAARSIVAEVDPRIMVTANGTMADHLGDTMALERIAGGLLGALGLMALLLAAVGIYGVVSFAVSRRRHEVGIRIALGARRDSVIRLFVRDVSVVMIVGALVGAGLAIPVTRLVGTMFTGTTASPVAMAGVTTLLVLTSLVATVVPAMRATRVDPREALRLE